jgi:putative effector of murein hydrolase LrgA (UPF0299 family)
MLHYVTLLVCCQLAGELIVTAVKAPLPGPVLGMAILFIGLVINGGIPDELGKVADGFLTNLSLLFVPAGTGIMLHVGLISRDVVPIAASILISTIATIAVTSLVMSALSPKEPSDAAPPGGEPAGPGAEGGPGGVGSGGKGGSHA